MVVTQECLNKEFDWHEQHVSQLMEQHQSSQHPSRYIKIETEIEEEEKAEEHGLSKIGKKYGNNNFTTEQQKIRIKNENLTGSNIFI